MRGAGITRSIQFDRPRLRPFLCSEHRGSNTKGMFWGEAAWKIGDTHSVYVSASYFTVG